MNLLKLTFSLLILISFSCSKQEFKENSSVGSADSWLIDIDQILHFDSRKDPIQSLDTNIFTDHINSLLTDDEVVVSYYSNGVVKVYPMAVLQSHEIINDSIGNHYFSITHCPLTSSTIAWDRYLDGRINSFGVSGKLFKENLIPYDRNTGSHWSQMYSQCVNGKFSGYYSEHLNIAISNYALIKRSYPNALVLDHTHCTSEGCSRTLKITLEEPLDGQEDDLNSEEQYYGIVRENAVDLITVSNLADSLIVKHIVISGKRMVFISNSSLDYQKVFEIEDQKFSVVVDSLPWLMKDDSGNYYDVFGKVIDGPNIGESLKSVNSYFALTFAWQNLFDKRTIINIP